MLRPTKNPTLKKGRPLFELKMQKFFLSLKESRIEATSPNTYYGCFYLGPFENGQGLTVANALRRTLLSQISGISITSAQVNKTVQEYSSLEGVRESVLDILLNLKEIVLIRLTDKPLTRTQLGYVQARGPGVVRASDLRLPPNIQCVNPDQYIATLNENGSLILRLKINEGRNFANSNSNEFNELQIDRKVQTASSRDFLVIDSVFTPIKRVNYTIESYGAESIQKSNQMIVFEVWTNGAILPQEAIYQSLNYLRVLFTNLGEIKVLDSLITTYSLIENKSIRETLEKFEQTVKNFKFDPEP